MKRSVLREEAEGYLSQVVSKSEGEAKRFTQPVDRVSKGAASNSRSVLYIDAIEQVMTNSTKILVDTEGGNNMLYLPLDKLCSRVLQSKAQRRGSNDQMIDRLPMK